MEIASNGPLLLLWILYLAALVWLGYRVHSRWNKED